ncbi:MAG: hypothetical protein ABF533_08755 [Acetobacter persici]|uniref:hypothetical protein n=1 Tax=Acetobacter persici TaxID=1076596 RepID=UPI0039EC7E9B
MIMLCELALWAAAFWSHAFLQPRRGSPFPRSARAVLASKILRMLGPCCALALCLIHNPALGVLYWLGLGGVAGVSTSLVIAVLRQKQGLAGISKPPL